MKDVVLKKVRSDKNRESCAEEIRSGYEKGEWRQIIIYYRNNVKRDIGRRRLSSHEEYSRMFLKKSWNA